MVSIRNVNQLGCDAETVSNFPHTPLKNRSHIQLFPDLPHVGVFTFEEKARSSSRYVQLFDLRQHVDDLFCNAVRKELVLRIGTHVDERQHGDRGLCGMGADATILRDLCDETVAAPGESFYKPRTLCRIVQGFAQLLDRVVEAAIKVDESIRGPDSTLQFLTSHNPAGLFQENLEDLERLFLKANFHSLLE
jgi:hypothetical protein